MAAEKLETRIRQDQIARAALSVVASNGLKRLSVARVARRVGVVPSALYRHFASKEDILDAALRMVQERLIENVRIAREEAPDALGRLHCLLKRHLALLEENPGIPRLMFSDDVYAGRKERRARMYRGIRGYLDRVADIVREGQRQRQVRKSLDPDAVALLFLGLVQPAAILSHVSGGAFDAAGCAEKAWIMFADALRRR